jgi:uncharacterized phage protein (TIGR01671 family)
MNREIKFRVWNKGINSMYSVYGFNQRQIQWGKDDGSLGGSFSYGQNNKNKFILMQFTGLSDKNGKDIYDGDIVKRSLSGSNPTTTDKVYFQNGSFVIGEGDFIRTISSFCTLEVIGNIYENPELLSNAV